MRHRVVEAEPSSGAFVIRRHQPIVPAAKPNIIQWSEFLASTPPFGAANTRPLAGLPAIHAWPFTVTTPSSVPVGAASAVTGWTPERSSITPPVKILDMPSCPRRALRSPVESFTVMVTSFIDTG